MSGNVVEQETISTRGFPSGNEVMYMSEAFERKFEKGYLLA